MEDRTTPGVYLEFTDLSASVYAATRVAELLHRPGVRRVSWWENARPHRRDLPRTIPEFARLGVCEVDDRFAPPTAPNGATGHHYLRTSRPAQGRLTGRPTLGLLLVLISPRHAADATVLRDWADFVHLRHIAEAAVPGFTMITPYEHVNGGTPRYLHLYEMDTDEPESAFRNMEPLVGELVGPRDSEEWKRWAFAPELRIDYVNTFRRVGVRRARKS